VSLKNFFVFRKNRPPLFQGLFADPWIGGFNFTELSLRYIQTAGYSGQARAEIVLAGIEDSGTPQEKIMGFVQREEPVAVEGDPAVA